MTSPFKSQAYTLALPPPNAQSGYKIIIQITTIGPRARFIWVGLGLVAEPHSPSSSSLSKIDRGVQGLGVRDDDEEDEGGDEYQRVLKEEMNNGPLEEQERGEEEGRLIQVGKTLGSDWSVALPFHLSPKNPISSNLLISTPSGSSGGNNGQTLDPDSISQRVAVRLAKKTNLQIHLTLSLPDPLPFFHSHSQSQSHSQSLAPSHSNPRSTTPSRSFAQFQPLPGGLPPNLNGNDHAEDRVRLVGLVERGLIRILGDE